MSGDLNIHPGIRALLLGLFLLLGACASDNGEPEVTGAEDPTIGQDPGDPHEAFNRRILKKNLWIYDEIMTPVVDGYVWATPDFVRQGLSNVLDNLSTPRIFINDLLQGEWERAAVSFARLAFNTTIGFGGLFDRASQMGLERHDEDFGQTLAVWGVGDEPYLMLLLLGPSNPRDAVGWVANLAMDPINYLFFPIGISVNIPVRTVDTFARSRERIDGLREGSIDFYTTLRQAYRQNRLHEILNGEGAEEAHEDAFDSFDEMDEMDEFDEAEEPPLLEGPAAVGTFGD